jgi:dTDP-glucose 4,6-dehydratase
MSDQHKPVNIGNPIEMTIQQMADKILQATASKSKIVQVPLPEDDPKTRQPNITLAKKLLDWEPKISLDEGLESTLKYFKQQLNSS